MANPIAQTIANLILLRRVGNGLTRDVRAMVRDLVDEVVGHVARIDPTGPSRERYRRERLAALLAQIEATSAEQYREIERRLRDSLARIGADQAEIHRSDLADLIAGAARLQPLRGLGVTHFKRVLDADPFQGDLLSGWVERSEFQFVTQTRTQLQLGFAQQEPAGELGRRIRRNVAPMSRRHGEAIARTGITYMTNRAGLDLYRENDDVLDGVRFTAVLDTRTTPICIRWDGTVWPVDSPDIQVPPLHWQCRSTLVPEVAWERLGLEAPPETTRASADGQISSAITAEQWFGRQSAATQDEMIGRTRAELYRAGKITFRDMIARDNRVVPVGVLQTA